MADNLDLILCREFDGVGKVFGFAAAVSFQAAARFGFLCDEAINAIRSSIV